MKQSDGDLWQAACPLVVVALLCLLFNLAAAFLYDRVTGGPSFMRLLTGDFDGPVLEAMREAAGRNMLSRGLLLVMYAGFDAVLPVALCLLFRRIALFKGMPRPLGSAVAGLLPVAYCLADYAENLMSLAFFFRFPIAELDGNGIALLLVGLTRLKLLMFCLCCLSLALALVTRQRAGRG